MRQRGGPDTLWLVATHQKCDGKAPNVSPSQNHEWQHVADMHGGGRRVDSNVDTSSLFGEHLVEEIAFSVAIKSGRLASRVARAMRKKTQ